MNTRCIRLLPFVACLGIALVACTNASARDGSNRWLRVAHDSSYDIAIDTTQITPRYGQEYILWYRTDHAVTHLHNGKPFNREVVQSILRCGSMSFKVLSVDMSLGADRPIARQRTGSGQLDEQPWRHVEPESIEEVAAKTACDFARNRFAAGSR